MRRAWPVLILLAVGRAAAEDATAPAWTKYVTPILADRVRLELVDWFDPPPSAAREGAERYAFFANQLRAGFKLAIPHLTLHVEGQDVRLEHLPDDASLAPPYGNLGPGALYFAHTHGLDQETSQGETFLRQGFVTLSDPPGVTGLSLTGGRFEYSDGLETVPQDPALAWLKRQRIGERLVGPFNYTHMGRSFDGLKAAYDHPLVNVTAIGVHPTHGGFEVSAMREMGDVGLAGVAATLKGIPQLSQTVDARLFYLAYEDDRFDDEREEEVRPLKVDNRPVAERRADDGAIRVHTIGAHAAAVVDAGPGRVDGLLWGAGQTGDWGMQSHSAWAYAVEAGYQLPKCWGAPWLRFGVNQSSGDDDPADDQHQTFFQILPTARIYAQFPFFNFMNSQDLFGQLILKPHPKVTIRTDYHWLRLTEKKDLWYSGGGATNDDVFGFAGIPSNDRRELASLVDLTVTVALLKQLTASLYYGHAFGQGVVRKTFTEGTAADYGYLELTYRY
jgi:hypothetical protein